MRAPFQVTSLPISVITVTPAQQCRMGGHVVLARVCAQPDEAGVRGPEPAAAEVERAQVVLEVDMQPRAPGRAGLAGGDLHQPGADSVPPQRPGHHGVEDERVHAAVPGHVDEPGQLGTAAGTHPAQAVPVHLRLPVMVGGSAAEAAGVQGLNLGAGEVAAPLVADHRATVRTAWTK